MFLEISFDALAFGCALRYHTGIPLTAPQGQKAPPVTISELIDQEKSNSTTLKFLNERWEEAQRKYDELEGMIRAERPEGLRWDCDEWGMLLGSHANVVRAGMRVAQFSQQIADAVHARCRNDWDGVTGEH